MADEVVCDWPDRLPRARSATTLGPRDAVCVLTHDEKFDVPAIVGALADPRRLPRCDGEPRGRTPSGSQRLREAGVDDDGARARVMAPIGLDIGARTPEETAIAICAEIIARAHRPSRARRCATAPDRSTPE